MHVLSLFIYWRGLLIKFIALLSLCVVPDSCQHNFYFARGVGCSLKVRLAGSCLKYHCCKPLIRSVNTDQVDYCWLKSCIFFYLFTSVLCSIMLQHFQLLVQVQFLQLNFRFDDLHALPWSGWVLAHKHACLPYTPFWTCSSVNPIINLLKPNKGSLVNVKC